MTSNGNGSRPAGLIDLDELAPEPLRLKLNGRTLLVGELPHTEHVRLQKRITAYQEMAKAEDADPEAVDAEDAAILDAIFRPFNPDLPADFWAPVGRRRMGQIFTLAWSHLEGTLQELMRNVVLATQQETTGPPAPAARAKARRPRTPGSTSS